MFSLLMKIILILFWAGLAAIIGFMGGPALLSFYEGAYTKFSDSEAWLVISTTVYLVVLTVVLGINDRLPFLMKPSAKSDRAEADKIRGQ